MLIYMESVGRAIVLSEPWLTHIKSAGCLQAISEL